MGGTFYVSGHLSKLRHILNTKAIRKQPELVPLKILFPFSSQSWDAPVPVGDLGCLEGRIPLKKVYLAPFVPGWEWVALDPFLTGWLSLPLAVSTMRVGDLPLWFTTLFQCPESCSVYSRCAWISSWWTDEQMKCSCFCCKGKDYLGKDEQLQTKLKTYFT